MPSIYNLSTSIMFVLCHLYSFWKGKFFTRKISPQNSMLTLRDFDFLKIIGTGTFGKVFLAKLIGSNKYYAIKRMDKELLKENRQLDNIQSEANILAEVSSSPFVVKYKKLIETETNMFLIMEYVIGGELFYYMKKYGRFPPEAVLFFSCEVLMALKFIHNKDIIYRDLKPENILVSGDGHIKLADFGFATKVNTNVFLLCGTPEYMAPEKLLGNGDTKETDYWSFGCLIYEMVCGAPPYYSTQTDVIYKRILSEPVAFPDDVSGPIQDLLTKLLIKDRESRLGCKGIEEIMSHPYFEDVNWEDVENLRCEPPFLPHLYQFQSSAGLTADQRRKIEYRPIHSYKRLFRVDRQKITVCKPVTKNSIKK
ncbi:AGC/PKA protein kinase [Vittaforma corneae ATCC 50505]|uniref:cAMP-dependent protein kinase n=1 Tax=Vittaforma corneae (strain ATCC 50505) TaxID=993615 RepID=L2GLL2_VITCO|nr:AGC/PKA protein kinase [Vittaforma corneae ATCC 50505]ELA41778.1 AGC/PKA protein kinase [Vittaforma corneae ATCC 50505]